MKGYHYTNPKAYKSMRTKGIDGYISDYDNVAGLIPRKRFVRLGKWDLPDEAHEGVVEGLLNPEPKSWIHNEEFPSVWLYLLHDICREDEIMLLSFDIKPKDLAFVVDRAHIERELYRESKGQGPPTPATTAEAYRKYWESRVPALKYDGEYDMPQLAIWSPIPFRRLEVEWVKSSEKFYDRAKRMVHKHLDSISA